MKERIFKYSTRVGRYLYSSGQALKYCRSYRSFSQSSRIVCLLPMLFSSVHAVSYMNVIFNKRGHLEGHRRENFISTSVRVFPYLLLPGRTEMASYTVRKRLTMDDSLASLGELGHDQLKSLRRQPWADSFRDLDIYPT